MRPASRTCSRPLTSSTPILSRPTVGRSMSNSTRAMALPMAARLTRCCSSAPIEAPTSSTTDSPLSVGQSAGDRRPLDALDHLEIEARHGHQRAGIAGRDHDIGLALLHRVDRQPHRGLPAPVAQRLARLVVHADRHLGMHQLRVGLEPRQALEQGLHHGAVAEQQEFDIGMAGERNIGARQDDRGTMVAAHGVKRDANLIGHGSTSAALAWTPATSVKWIRRTGATIAARSRQTSRFWRRSMACPPVTAGRRRGAFSALPARQMGVRRHLRPWAARIGRRPCADRDRCQGSGIRSPARRDRRVPSTSGSGGSSSLRARLRALSARRSVRRLARREHQVDRLLDLALDRLQRHHAGLADPGAHLAGDVDAGALAGQIEYGRQPRQFAHGGEFGHARRGWRPGPRSRYAGRCPGCPPRPPARSRDCPVFSFESGSYLVVAGIVAGSGKCSSPPARLALSCAARSRNASRI